MLKLSRKKSVLYCKCVKKSVLSFKPGLLMHVSWLKGFTDPHASFQGREEGKQGYSSGESFPSDSSLRTLEPERFHRQTNVEMFHKISLTFLFVLIIFQSSNILDFVCDQLQHFSSFRVVRPPLSLLVPDKNLLQSWSGWS